MREIDLTTSCEEKEIPLRDRMYRMGAYARIDDGRHVMEAVENILIAHGLELAYGVNPADNDEVLLLVVPEVK